MVCTTRTVASAAVTQSNIYPLLSNAIASLCVSEESTGHTVWGKRVAILNHKFSVHAFCEDS